MIEKSVSLLRGLQRFLQAVEGVIVDLVAAVSPWFAPVLPAVMAYDAMVLRLGLPWWVGASGAVVVESLGLSAIQTVFTLWQYNQTKSARNPGAPMWLAVVTGVFYLSTILTVNVMLDHSGVTERLAKALLSLLSLPGGVVLALRAQHARRVEQICLDRDTKRQFRQKFRQERQEERQEVFFGDWRHVPVVEAKKIALMSTSQIALRYGLPERTARNWKKLAMKGNGNGNGNAI